MTEHDLAIALIEQEPDALMTADLDGKPLEDWRTGDYQAWTQSEHDEFQSFVGLTRGYLALKAPKRPLCLAVFGPPGSGKSFGVRKVQEILADEGPSLVWTEINLTQFASSAQLGGLLAASGLGGGVPLVFFDEFDAPLNGTPLGWLNWFLAPMHDGTFEAGGSRILKRAIYVFAGGTAATYGEFSGRRDSAFVAAKGPDFVSRLRGYLDVRGPNEPKRRALRRAGILRAALADATKSRGEAVVLSEQLRGDLLDVGRYRHGARSISAVVELTALASPSSALDRQHLPADHVLAIHADAGPLDAGAIGGLIGISGGGLSDAVLAKTWRKCATTIWSQGGSIAYGGSWEDLTSELRDELNGHPLPLSRDPKPDPRLRIFATEPSANESANERERVVAVPPAPMAGPLGRALQMFSLRWLMTCRCRARILMAGKTEEFSGRMPGVIEEGVLALAMGQPLYLIGAHGGAALLLGNLLGLSSQHLTSFPTIDLENDTELRANASLFQPAGAPPLPITFRDAVTYVQGFAPSGGLWPNNGLSFEENQELFHAKPEELDRIGELVSSGLTRIFT